MMGVWTSVLERYLAITSDIIYMFLNRKARSKQPSLLSENTEQDTPTFHHNLEPQHEEP